MVERSKDQETDSIIHYVDMYGHCPCKYVAHPGAAALVLGTLGELIQPYRLLTSYPCWVTCPDCSNTEIYKKDQLTFEVGCDGDINRWNLYIFNKRDT